MTIVKKYKIGLLIGLLTIGLLFVWTITLAQTNTENTTENTIPLPLQELAIELSCSDMATCEKLFDEKLDNNFDEAIALAEKHEVYTEEEKNLATTYKDKVLAELSGVNEADLQEKIIELAKEFLSKDKNLAKKFKLEEKQVSAISEIVNTVK